MTTTAQATANNFSTLSPEQTISLIVAGAIGLTLTGCGGSGGGGGGGGSTPPPAAITIDELSLRVSTATSTSLQVSGTDEAAGASHSSTGSSHDAALKLNNAELPQDPGANKGALHLGFDLLDGTGDSTHCHVVINPLHQDVVNSDPVAFAERKHLLDAIGIGATWAEIEAAMGVDYNTLVDNLVDTIRSDHFTAPPAFTPTAEFAGYPEILSGRERRELGDARRRRYNDMVDDWDNVLRRWWYQEILQSPHPLTERLVLFWHGLWTSSLQGSSYPQLMYNQNKLIRQYSTDFKEMARRLTKDPAMVQYLDSESNIKDEPNENFARELVELFTLGEGKDYTEADVPEIARCFTGYTLTDHYEFTFDTEEHDTGSKTVFGVNRGNINGDDVMDLIFAKRRCAEYLCERLVIEFVGRESDGQPLASLVSELTDELFPSFDLKPVLKTLFKHSEFRKASRRGSRVKSPVELLIGTFRRLEMDYRDREPGQWIVGQHILCEQDLFRPPNVNGWPDGSLWVDAKNLLVRIRRCYVIGNQFVDLVPKHIFEFDDDDNLVAGSGIESLLLPLPKMSTPDSRRANTYLRTLLTDPTYQLV